MAVKTYSVAKVTEFCYPVPAVKVQFGVTFYVDLLRF